MHTSDPNCLFCKIISGEISTTKVFEDDYTFAFLDINPNSIGHTQVIPKDHFENIYGLPDETLCRIALTVKKISIAIKNALDADGINISMNNEPAAGQVIFHSHTHIIPRKNDDGLVFGSHKKYADGEAELVAEKIREKII